MVGMPGYDKSAILAALKEGPKTASEAPQPTDGRTDAQQGSIRAVDILYGTCDADDLQTVGVSVEDETPKASAMAVLLNDRLIKCTLNVLDSGDFPTMFWRGNVVSGLAWGTGVSRKIRTVQRILNGALRAMMDNSGLTAGPQIVIGNGITRQTASGRSPVASYGARKKGDRRARGVFRVRAAVNPGRDDEHHRVGNEARRGRHRNACDAQGIRGDAPETLGGMQMQNNNASSVLRRLAKRFDDYVTEPHITRYYEWMMQHRARGNKGRFPDRCRGQSPPWSNAMRSSSSCSPCCRSRRTRHTRSIRQS